MKHLLQFVAFILVGLLALPAVLAQVPCFTFEAQTANMECCNVDRIGAAIVAAPVVLDCNETCCSVAPQNSPASNVPDKFMADSTAPAASDGMAVLVPVTLRDLHSPLITKTGCVQDLPVLLRTLRV